MFIADSAEISDFARVSPTAHVWHLAQIREGAAVGDRTIVGRGAYIDCDVDIGNDCKIQNFALIYGPSTVEAGVFIGPAAVLTNDRAPRAVTVTGMQKREFDWRRVGVLVRHGASIGASAVCVAPVEIGQWAMVAAGAVVVDNVPAFALVAGVPAKQMGWVGRYGVRLTETEASRTYSCPASGALYFEENGVLREAAGPNDR